MRLGKCMFARIIEDSYTQGRTLCAVRLDEVKCGVPRIKSWTRHILYQTYVVIFQSLASAHPGLLRDFEMKAIVNNKEFHSISGWLALTSDDLTYTCTVNRPKEPGQ